MSAERRDGPCPSASLAASLAASLLFAFAAALPAAASTTPLEGAVLDVQGETVKLDLGEEQGVTVGQIFDLYQEARAFKLPLTMGDRTVVTSHRRVGRAQVFRVELASATARLLAREEAPDGGRVALEPGRVRAIHNPTITPPNRRPEFLPHAAPKAVAWGETLPLSLRVDNEADDAVVYTWSVTGGRLAHRHTLRPVNDWTAPPEARTHRVTVSVRDSAGHVAHTALDVVSTGIAGRSAPAPTRFEPGRQFGSESRYGHVADLAFDGLGRRYFLNPKRGWTGRPVLRVENPGPPGRLHTLPVSGRTFTAIAAADPQVGLAGAFLALDGSRKTILRYTFLGARWGEILERPPLVMGRTDGAAGNARFTDPIDLAISRDGEVYVLDAGQRSVQVFALRIPPGEDESAVEGVFQVSFGRPGGGPFQLDEPRALALGRDGAAYVLDNGRKAVVIYRGWRPVAELSVGEPEDDLCGLAVDPFTSEVYVLDRRAGVVRRYDGSGQLLGQFGQAEGAGHPARLRQPTRLRIEPTRVLWVVDQDGASVVRFDHQGEFLGRTGGVEFSGPLRVAGLPHGGFAALDRRAYQVTCFDSDGWVTARFGELGSRQGEFGDPIDLAVASTGDVFVLDADKRSIIKFSPSGAYLGTLGRPGSEPRDLDGVMGLSAVNDRSYLAVIQQRPEDNFNLFHPGTGHSERTWGQLAGELTPRFGSVTGVTGSLGSTGPESGSPWFWSVDDRRRRVFRGRPGFPPSPVAATFSRINAIQSSVVDQVFVVDIGSDRVVVLDAEGLEVAVIEEGLDSPWSIGLDDFGTAYVYDRSRKRVVELVPAN